VADLNALAERGGGETWWRVHLATCTHPTIVGSSEHVLYLGRKLELEEDSGD
jgi:hypothetical protein